MQDEHPNAVKNSQPNADQIEDASDQDITLDRVLSGEISSTDIRISPAALHNQAAIADDANRTALADNLRRAAELTGIPNEEILAIYNALRPHRSTRDELEGICDRLESEYGASTTAQFIRDALLTYEQKGLLRRR